VRLDADVFAMGEVASTEARATHNRYLAYVLEASGHRPGARRRHGRVAPRPQPAARPLDGAGAGRRARAAAARASGLRTGVISNSNGTIKRILTRLELLPLVDFALDSSEEAWRSRSRHLRARAGAGRRYRRRGRLRRRPLFHRRPRRPRRPARRAPRPGGCWGGRDCPTAEACSAPSRTAGVYLSRELWRFTAGVRLRIAWAVLIGLAASPPASRGSRCSAGCWPES